MRQLLAHPPTDTAEKKSAAFTLALILRDAGLTFQETKDLLHAWDEAHPPTVHDAYPDHERIGSVCFHAFSKWGRKWEAPSTEWIERHSGMTLSEADRLYFVSTPIGGLKAFIQERRAQAKLH